MRLRDKVLYMLVGGFLVFLGQLLPSALNANNASKIEFDSVVCRTLRVTDNILVSPTNDTDNRGVKIGVNLGLEEVNFGIIEQHNPFTSDITDRDLRIKKGKSPNIAQITKKIEITNGLDKPIFQVGIIGEDNAAGPYPGGCLVLGNELGDAQVTAFTNQISGGSLLISGMKDSGTEYNSTESTVPRVQIVGRSSFKDNIVVMDDINRQYVGIGQDGFWGSIDLFQSYENMVHFGVRSRIHKKEFNRTKFLTFE